MRPGSKAHHEWGSGLHEDGFGLHSSDEVDSPTGFAAWVRLTAQADPAKPVDAGRVHCTYRWIVEDDRGLATWALGRMLGEAEELGLDRVLIVCAADNVASAKTIEHHGGVLEDVRDTEYGPMRRYWTKTGKPSA